MNRRLKYLLPPAIVVLGVVVAAGLIASRKPVETREVSAAAPLVEVIEVEKRDIQFTVPSQGTVKPRTEIALVAEVGGRVVRLSPEMVNGGFFEKGDVLVTLEAVDYRAEVDRARSAVTQAELRLAQEKAQAEVAVREWERLGEGEASPLTSRELHVRDAEAAVEAARATLAQAEKNLARTQITAPFTGRVLEESVDVGQYVPRGTTLGRIYAVDYVEIELPVTGDDAPYVDLPMAGSKDGPYPQVHLTSDVGGETATWEGTIVRTGGRIDERTRVLHAVARVDDPYGLRGDREAPPLTVGAYVDAVIMGRLARDVFVVPRAALRAEGEVWVVSDESRLHRKPVSVLRRQGEQAIIDEGLEPGNRVCVSPLEASVEGMQVRVAEDTTAAASGTLP